MAKTVSISVPHQLTQQEVKARIQQAIGDLRSRHGARLADVQETWNENRLDFALKAMGQPISGRIDILPQDVRLEVDLPWMLAMLAGNLRTRVESEGRKLLEKK